MKSFFKILKLTTASLLLLYSLAVIYFLMFSPAKERYDYAASIIPQGTFMSQSIFEILKFQEPSNDMVYFEQSVPFNKKGYYERGFELLDKAVELNPKVHLGYRGYMKLRFLRNYRGALKDLDHLDSLTPNVTDAAWGEDIDFLRGEAWFGLKNYNKAEHFFQKSIENQGKDWADVQAFVYLGVCSDRLGNPEEAIRYYREALEQSEYTVEAHLGLAETYRSAGEFEKARIHLKQAEKYFRYKRNNLYYEFLNEVYKEDITDLKSAL